MVQAVAPQRKIFAIGFHKTATTSLGEALHCLGYRVHGGVTSDVVCSVPAAKQKARDLCAFYDALQDMPWPILYEWFDRTYLGSKFILTVRDETDWIDSVCRHFGGRTIRRHEWIYGEADPVGNEDVYLRRYRRHCREVKDHFGSRIGTDLLVMDITAGDGWEVLAPFLDEPVPFAPFPSSNFSPEKWAALSLGERVALTTKEKLFGWMSKYRRIKKSYEHGRVWEDVRSLTQGR